MDEVGRAALLFGLGAFGAAAVVYLAKQQLVPELRPLFDVTARETELDGVREHVKCLTKHIDDTRTKLEGKEVSANLAERLKTSLETALTELEGDRKRERELENAITTHQFLVRGLGFILYIILGGVVGAALGDRIDIEGISGDVPKYFQAAAIGATWTTFLSIFGVKVGLDKADDAIESLRKEFTEKLDSFRQLLPNVTAEVEKAERSPQKSTPVVAHEVSHMLSEQLDETSNAFLDSLDRVRMRVRRAR